MPKKSINDYNFSRRALITGGVKFTLLSALGVRFYYLQVSEAEKYKLMADGNRIRVSPIVPLRGSILDRHGVTLAEGTSRYQVVFDPVNHSYADDVIQNIAGLLKLEDNELNNIHNKLSQHKHGHAIIVKDFLEWKDVAKIEVNSIDLPGVSIESPEVRNYQFGSITAHLTGYVGTPSSKELDKGKLYKHPEFRIGKTGIEKSFDSTLRGKAGLRHLEVDSKGAFVRELDIDKSESGKDVNITIDSRLQNFVYETISNKGGILKEGASAVVIDITNGDILAMSSVPSYDPNEFLRGISHKKWNELVKNPDSPLSNKAVQLQYPPGSTFKIMTSLAALEEGLITSDTTHYCPGYYKFGGRKFHCWNKQGHGNLDITGAIAKSCNVYFFKIATSIGVDKMAEMARRFGLGSLTGIELPNEKKGLVPTIEWKNSELGKPWYGGETLNNSIGQGYLLATPLQLAVMASRIASGRMVVPRIILPYNEMNLNDFIDYPSGFDKVQVSEQHLRAVQIGMEAVVNTEGGGSYKSRIKEKEWAMAGKTGTAQVLSHRRFKNVPAERSSRFHAIYIGYAPIFNPRYAVSVVVEHGGYGSQVAAPIGRDILREVQRIS